MRKWRRLPDILLGGLLAISVFAIGYSVSRFAHPPATGAGEDQQQHISNLADVLWATLNYVTKDATTLSTLFLAFSTFFLWQRTSNLAQFTKDLAVEAAAQRSLSEDTAERQLRAYVCIKKIDMVAPNLTNTTYKPHKIEKGTGARDHLIVWIKNYGITPANRVHTWVSWGGMPFAERLPKGFTYPRHDTVTLAGPEELRPTWNVPVIPSGEEIDQAISINNLTGFIDAKKGTHTMYLWAPFPMSMFSRSRGRLTSALNFSPEKAGSSASVLMRSITKQHRAPACPHLIGQTFCYCQLSDIRLRQRPGGSHVHGAPRPQPPPSPRVPPHQESLMSRPESVHVTALRAFRDKLVEARRATARMEDIDAAARRFLEIQTAIGLVDKAMENEKDLTPLPAVDDPTTRPPFPDSDKGPPLIETI